MSSTVKFTPPTDVGLMVPNEVIQSTFFVYLYSNQDNFVLYQQWADPNGSTATTFQKNNSRDYSGYTLRFDCKISNALVKTGSGCCLQDASGQSGDGYCLLQAEDVTKTPILKYAQTYFIANSQFNIILADPYEISAGLAVVANDSNLEGFQRFMCSTSIADSQYVCDKYQLWPAASYLGGFRFEKGFLANAYFYDLGKTGIKRWNKNVIQLTGSLSGLLAGSVVAALSMFILF